MLTVQQNCGNEFECIISAIKAGLGFNAAVVYIFVLNDLLAGWTASPAGKQTSLANSIEVWVRKLDKSRFDCLSSQ